MFISETDVSLDDSYYNPGNELEELSSHLVNSNYTCFPFMLAKESVTLKELALSMAIHCEGPIEYF